MLNINKILGIEKLFADKTSVDLLKQSIMDEVRYVIPGYGCDYYLRTYGRGLEFELCKGLDGTDHGIAVHFSGRQMITLTLDHVISTEDSAHLFRMHSEKAPDSLSVRIVCPDVLAGPESGDSIYGQIEAFAGENILITEELPGKEGFVKDNGKQ